MIKSLLAAAVLAASLAAPASAAEQEWTIMNAGEGRCYPGALTAAKGVPMLRSPGTLFHYLHDIGVDGTLDVRRDENGVVWAVEVKYTDPSNNSPTAQVFFVNPADCQASMNLAIQKGMILPSDVN
jgi:hypothetical protein